MGGCMSSVITDRLFTYKYFHCIDACLVTRLVYIGRIMKLYSHFVVSTLVIYRLLAAILER